jgi:nitrate/nitrite transporter NarK
MSTDKTAEAFGGFIAISIGIVIFFAMIFGISALEAHIVGDLANLFNIPHLKELTFMQLYGLAIVWGIFSSKLPKKDAEGDYSAWLKLVMYATSFLVVWGTAHVFHHFFA